MMEVTRKRSTTQSSTADAKRLRCDRHSSAVIFYDRNHPVLSCCESSLSHCPRLFCCAISGILFRVFHQPPYYGDIRNIQNPSALNSSLPSLDCIFSFFFKMYMESEMEQSCGIVSLIYVTRVIAKHNRKVSLSNIPHEPYITGANWRSILIASAILSSKVLDDFCMTNADFADVFLVEGLTNSLVNSFEANLLEALDFMIFVDQLEYDRYGRLVEADIMLLENLSTPSPMTSSSSSRDSAIGGKEDKEEDSQALNDPSKASKSLDIPVSVVTEGDLPSTRGGISTFSWLWGG